MYDPFDIKKLPGRCLIRVIRAAIWILLRFPESTALSHDFSLINNPLPIDRKRAELWERWQK
jgi:hypothetical protein